MEKKFRRWCFTDFALLSEYRFTSQGVRFAIWQLEECPDSGKWHYQGYIELLAPRNFEFLKKHYFHNSTSFRKCDGNQKQNIDYCTKTETRLAGPWKYGTPAEPGQRKDLQELVEKVKNGSSDVDLLDESTLPAFAKYYKFVDRVRSAVLFEKSKTFRKVETFVLIGPAGTGKTKTVFEREKIDGVYTLSLDTNNAAWFDGYTGQKTLLIDEFYGWLKYSDLLRILDGYQYRLNIKGSTSWALWDKVFITSNKSPDLWYPNMGLSDALRRRIFSIEIIEGTEVGGNTRPPPEDSCKTCYKMNFNLFFNLNFSNIYKRKWFSENLENSQNHEELSKKEAEKLEKHLTLLRKKFELS